MASNRVVAVRLRAEMAQFKKEWGEAGKAVGDAAGQMDAAAKKAAATKVQLDAAGTTVGRAAVRIRENRQEWDHVGTSMLKAGAGLTIGAGLVTKAAMDWESQWTGVLKTVDGTPAQLGKVEDGLRGLAKTLPSSHEEIAAVAEAAGQLGIETGNVVGFTRTMIDLGETTNLSASEAATSLARFSNIMGTNQKDVGRLGSSIVGLGNHFATTESEILALATRLAGAGVQAKLSEGDVFGIATAMSSVGVEAEAGGSAMSLTMKRIGKEVESGGSKLGQFAEVAGMSSDGFAKAWKEDAGGALASFVEGLGETEASGKSTNAVLSELGVTGLRESDALLRLSSASGVLRDAMNQGNADFERNSALTDEAAKRYDTAEAQVSIAWNNIKDSAIDAGQAMLPVVEQIANAVNLVTDAFSGLSGPIKGALGPIAAFSGVALLAVGGTMKLSGAILDARTSMNALQIDAPRTSKALAGAAKGAAILTAALVAVDASANLFDASSVASVEKFTAAMLELSSGGKGAGDTLESLSSRKAGTFLGASITGDVKSLSDAIDTLDASKMEKFLNSGFGESKIDLAAQSIAQVDSALASLVQSGATDEAAEGFEYYAKQAEKVGLSSSDALKQLPGYSDALTAAANQQTLAGDAAGDMAAQMESSAAAVGMSAEELQAAQEAAQATAEAFIGLGEGLNDSKVSLGDWLGELEKQNEALAAFTSNSIKAAKEGLDEGLIASLQAAGPEGAMRLAQLADASESEIGRANDAFRGGQDEIATYIAATTGIPTDVISEFKTPGAPDAIDTAVELAQKYEGLDATTVESILRALDYSTPDIEAVKKRLRDLDAQNATPTITLSAPGVSGQIGAIGYQINSLPSLKIVEIRAVKTGADIGAAGGAFTGMRVPQGFAGGGKVPGSAPSNPRIDNVMAVGANTGEPLKVRSGEWIINEKQSKQNDQWLAAVNSGLNLSDIFGDIRGFADGGRIDRLNAQRRVRDIGRDLREREKYGREPKRGKPDRRKTRYVLRGLDRTIAYEELKEARAELRDLRKPRSKRKDAVADRKKDAADARQQRRDDISGESESYRGNADIQSFTSPASVNRALGQAINDMATYTQLLIQLKKKGAAPWLLNQLQKAGPSRGSISLARKYLADTGALKAVNAQAAQLSAVSNIYGQVTTDARWDASKAWSGSLSSAQQRTINEGAKTVNLTVNPIPGMSDTQVANMTGSKIMQAFR